MHWIRPIAILTAVATIALYLGDWGVFVLRGSPTANVAVEQYLAIPLKGNRTEYTSAGVASVPCSQSLLPQGGLDPCWRVARHKTKTTVL